MNVWDWLIVGVIWLVSGFAVGVVVGRAARGPVIR